MTADAGGPAPDWQTITDAVRSHCRRSGFDLTFPFELAWYNRLVEERASCVPDFGRSRHLGLLIGNTRSLWSVFRQSYDADLELQRARDPLDLYTTRSIAAALAQLPMATAVYWAHVVDPAPIPIQRIAHAVGFARLGPSHLSIHPEHGPWIALRAVVIVDVDGPEGAPLPPADHCTSCEKPCVPALERALAPALRSGGPQAVEDDWLRWLAVRDACPQGRTSRYSDEQAAYHYTKLRSLLGR
jgi:methylmalonic aciduria homocystinuria type C protein